jgi:hypothetical protein
VDAGICKDANGGFATGATGLCKGSMELVADVVPQIQQLLQYPVSGCLASLAVLAWCTCASMNLSRKSSNI